MIFTGALILIQIVNTLSVLRVPVRLTIRAEEVDCYFPLRRITKRFRVGEIELVIVKNPIRICSFGDFFFLSSRDSRVGIWRTGIKGFDLAWDTLKTINAEAAHEAKRLLHEPSGGGSV